MKINNIRYISVHNLLNEKAMEEFAEKCPWTFGDTDFSMVSAKSFCQFFWNFNGVTADELVYFHEEIDKMALNEDASAILREMVKDMCPHLYRNPFPLIEDLYIAL